MLRSVIQSRRRQPDQRCLVMFMIGIYLMTLLVACAQSATAPLPASTSAQIPTTAATPQPTPAAPAGAFASGNYRNMFRERGKSDVAIQAKLDAAWQQLF